MSEDGLAVVEEDGIEAVTMRRVAEKLPTGPASSYRWVTDRSELLELMLDRVMDEVTLDAPDPTRSRQQIHALMDQTVAALRRHPGIAQTGLANEPTADSALKIREAMLAALLTGGVDPQGASWAIDTLPLLCAGHRA